MDFIRRMTERLRRMAVEDHKQHRQYDGYFDRWMLASASRSAKYKGGSGLFKGRWVLASPDMTSWYNPDNGHVCGIDSGALRPVPA